MLSIRHIVQDEPIYGEQVLPMRVEILRKPIGLNYLTSDDFAADEGNLVVIAEKFPDENSNLTATKEKSFQRPVLVGCCMLRVHEDDAYKLRQLAVIESERGQNIGKKLVLYAEQFCKNNGRNRIFIQSRTSTRGFYEKLGYKCVTEEFFEIGIPFIGMEKYLA